MTRPGVLHKVLCVSFICVVNAQYILRPELYTAADRKCKTMTTTVCSKVCTGQLIFDDEFNGRNIDETKWTIEHYVPLSDNYEFVSYRRSRETAFVQNSFLYLKPVLHDDVRGILNLTDGCTSDDNKNCILQQAGALLLPPVKSGKIKSKKAFRYGMIEIRAKLPAGDWIYPQIELNPSGTTDFKKIIIAYARGNEKLILEDGNDIGASLLFGGPVSSISEPERSINLRSIRFQRPATRDSHIYTLTWSPEKISMAVDHEEFGSVPANSYSGFNGTFHLTLGVGVGGLYEFPDDVMSGSFKKPWENFKISSMATFYKSRAEWQNTWFGDNSALVVDYVKIWAL